MGTDVIPLDTLGATIRAHVAKGDASIEKAEQHYKAAGIHLMEAKQRVSATPGLTWPAWLNTQCGIRRRRADELISIANGTTTLAEMRQKNRERVADHRKKKAESALRNAEGTAAVSKSNRAALRNDEPARAPDKLGALMRAWNDADRKTRNEFMRRECLVPKDWLEDAALQLLIAKNQPIPGALAESRWGPLGLDPPAQAVTPYTASEPRQYHYIVDKKTGKLVKVDDPNFDQARLLAEMKSLGESMRDFKVQIDPEAEFTEDQIPAFLKKDAA